MSGPRDLGDGVYEAEWCSDGADPGEPVSMVAWVGGTRLDRDLTIRVAPDRRRLGARSRAMGGCAGMAGVRPRHFGLRALIGL